MIPNNRFFTLTFKHKFMKAICNRFVFSGFLLVCFLLAAPNLQAQDDDLSSPYNRVFKVRPLQFGEVYLSWENIKHDDQSNELGIGFIYKSLVGANEKDKN